MKTLLMFLSVYFLFVPYSFGFDTIYAQKEKFKNSFVTEVPNTNDLIGTADRIEADALLELASEAVDTVWEEATVLPTAEIALP